MHADLDRRYGPAMARSVCPVVSAGDRARLEAIVADRNRPRKHVARARLVLLSADRLDVASVARRAEVSRPAVWRWQRRYAEAGVDGLLRDETRKPGKAPLGEALVRRVVALTCGEPPGEATHWTGRMMAKAVGISLRSVQRIWAAHKLQPHRLRTFKRSRDPGFVAKLEDIVGLYLAPPRHAIVLSVDEKSQIQALDRTQPGLPIKPGKAGRLTHCILDNYAAHKHPKVLAWLARHPRWTFHFTPTSGSWLNAVETFFSALTRRRIRRGTFSSVVDLQAAINRYLDEHNADPKPFTWTATPASILAKLDPLNASVH